jgi:two-component SAPR family response regulator
VPKKPITLLKAIVAMGGKGVQEQRLIDALWPDEDGDAAREAFAVSLHRLRKLLVHPDIVQLSDGLLTLDAGRCWIDARAFEHRVAKAPCTDDASGESVWALYRGHFLAEDADQPWAVPQRERLRSLFLHYVAKAGGECESAGRLEQAAALYKKGIESDDLAEEFYQGLMRCHIRSERRAEAMAVYRRLRQTLSVTLGISPSPQSEKLFRQLQAG